MGCAHSAEPLPQLPEIPPGSGIERLSNKTDKKTLLEVEDVMAQAFTGTTFCPGEGGLTWAFDMGFGNKNEDPTQPLKEEPDTPERSQYFRYVIRLCMYQTLIHGCCFAIRKEGKIVAATMCYPPSKRKLHENSDFVEMCCIMPFVKGPMPSALYEGSPGKRQVAVGKAMKEMHHKWMPDPHWYVLCFATDCYSQGNGYGRQLMEWMSTCAATTGHPLYLETMGPRNVRFYERNGYVVKEKYCFEWEKGICDVHGGLCIMVKDAPK